MSGKNINRIGELVASLQEEEGYMYERQTLTYAEAQASVQAIYEQVSREVAKNPNLPRAGRCHFFGGARRGADIALVLIPTNTVDFFVLKG